MKTLTTNQAIKLARKKFISEHGKRAYNADISIFSRYSSGHYILIIASGLTTEFYY